MPKRPSLFATVEPATEVVAVPILRPVPAPKASTAPPSRVGKRVLSIYLDPVAWKQIRQLALDTGTSTQALGAEAVNLLFERHGLNRSA